MKDYIRGYTLILIEDVYGPSFNWWKLDKNRLFYLRQKSKSILNEINRKKRVI